MLMRCAVSLGVLACLPVPALAGKLPMLPPGPVFSAADYPTCQNDWQKLTLRADRSNAATQCILALERYNTFVLPRFPRAVSKYSEKINGIETDFRKAKTPPADKLALAKLVDERLADYKSKDESGNVGSSYSDYYMTVQRYRDDTRLLRQEQHQ